MSKSVSFHQKSRKYSDQELYQGLLSNQRDSFAQLYQQVYPQAKALLKRMGANEEDVKDIFQEGMVALWRNAKQGKFQVQTDTKISTYLLQICKNQFLEKQRKASKREKSMTSLHAEPVEEGNFLDHWFQKEEMEKLSRHIRLLGQRCQNLLKRFYFERASLKKIALAMNLTEASAKNEKYRCMQRLKKTYQTS